PNFMYAADGYGEGIAEGTSEGINARDDKEKEFPCCRGSASGCGHVSHRNSPTRYSLVASRIGTSHGLRRLHRAFWRYGAASDPGTSGRSRRIPQRRG